MTRQRIWVIGAGWHAREVLAYFADFMATPAGAEAEIGGLIDDLREPGPFFGSNVVGGVADLAVRLGIDSRIQDRYITAVGRNDVRRRFVSSIDGLVGSTLQAFTLIHPAAFVGVRNRIGEGTCVAPGAVVTAEATIGRHCIVNANATIHHDCVVGDYTNINPGVTICGNVRLGEGCYIGAGATVIDKVEIGPGTTVGAGSVVTRNLPAGVTAYGVPARVARQH